MMINYKGIVFLTLAFLAQGIPFAILLLEILKKDSYNEISSRSSKSLRIFLVVLGWLLLGITIIAVHVISLHYINPLATINYVMTGNIYYENVKFFGYVVLAEIIIMLFYLGIVSWLDYARGRVKINFIVKKVSLLLLVVESLYVFIVMMACDNSVRNIRINEVCAHNQMLFLDDTNDTPDYVELYNPGIFKCRLSKLYISDSDNNLEKYPLTDLEIGPNDYFVVRISKEKTGFSLSNSGETVYLSKNDGSIVDSVTYNPMKADTAYSRVDDGKQLWAFMTCTPWQSNKNGEKIPEEAIKEPQFSVNSGIFDEEFNLEIYSEDDLSIYYTVDCSDPIKNGTEYKGSITVYDRSSEENIVLNLKNVIPEYDNYEPNNEKADKAFIVRAVCMDEDGNYSRVASKTYLVGNDKKKYEDKTVFSVVVDPDDLYGEEGIYVTGKEYDDWYMSGMDDEEVIPNFLQYGKRWERPGNISIINKVSTDNRSDNDVADTKKSDSEADNGINPDYSVGIRIFGGSARWSPVKRLSMYSRDIYGGNEYVELPFEDIHRAHSMVTRPGEANAILPYLADGLDVTWQTAEPIHYFLNGEYISDSYIQEKYSQEYFAEKYGVQKDSVIIYKGGGFEAGIGSDEAVYDELVEFIDNADWDRDESFVRLGDYIDIESYIDYWCFRLYLNDLDAGDGKNAVMWRLREPEDNEYGDCRWRWALYDLDAPEWGMAEKCGVEHSYMIDTFEQRHIYVDDEGKLKWMLDKLFTNDLFRKAFETRFIEISNQIFDKDRVERLLSEKGLDIQWNDGYFENRYEYIIKYMSDYFNGLN